MRPAGSYTLSWARSLLIGSPPNYYRATSISDVCVATSDLE